MFDNLICLFNNFPWDVFLFWLIPLLLLWWWLTSRINRYKAHADELQDRINFLEGELDACRKSKKPSGGGTAAVAGAAVGAAAVGVSAPAKAMAAAVPAKPKKDDLKVVEGIGPKIEELCNNAGIFTFAQLADTASSSIKEILTAAGSRFQMHDPTTWPEQAAMARDGKWDELKKWQDELNKGRA